MAPHCRRSLGMHECYFSVHAFQSRNGKSRLAHGTPLDPVTLRHFVAVCEEGSIARAAAARGAGRLGAEQAHRRARSRGRRAAAAAPPPRRRAHAGRRGAAGARARAAVGAGPRCAPNSVPSAWACRAACACWPARRCWPSSCPRTSAASWPCTRACASASTSASAPTSCAACAKVRPTSACCGTWPTCPACTPCPTAATTCAWPWRPSHPLARRPTLRYADTLDEVSVGVAPGGLMDQLTASPGRAARPLAGAPHPGVEHRRRLPHRRRRPGPGGAAARGWRCRTPAPDGWRWCR